MAPGPNGTLFVAIPRTNGAVLALLDASGHPSLGWPIAIDDSSTCSLVLPVDDGSVRVLCDATDLPPPELDVNDVRARAFDPAGRALAGWPVQLRPSRGRLVGDTATFLAVQLLGDVATPGRPTHEVRLTTVEADGSSHPGTAVPLFELCCEEYWAVDAEGGGVGVTPDWSAEVSEIRRIDAGGLRAGWPVQIDGVASGPSFGPEGRIVLTVGSFARRASRIVEIDKAGLVSSSPQLPIGTAESGVDCIPGGPEPPPVAPDGGAFLVSEIDPRIFAVDPSLQVRAGWPFTPSMPLLRPDPWLGLEGINCPPLAVPAVGPDGTLYLPLQARNAGVGGSIVAVGLDGSVRAGWPIELKRPGSEFWSVAIAPGGTVYGLAIEPEPEGRSSATILAIAPDGTILYRATIVDP
jgi:hypothetical protein